MLDLSWVRSQFPALSGDWVYFDNAGGSQTLQSVADRVSDYLLSTNVQLGASYAVSQEAGRRVAEATRAMAGVINARDEHEVVIGASTTQLLANLALAMRPQLREGDEVIVTNCDHEANIGPWARLADQGVTVKTWKVDPGTLELRLEDLAPLMSGRTRLVTFTHASNILGTINPVADIARFVHEHGARVCVDAVSYAPHRAVDVQAWDVDYYVFSAYKVYGPHVAVLYGKRELLEELGTINHYFVPDHDVPRKLQPGSVNYELSYGLLGVSEYLEALAVRHADTPADSLHGRVAQAYAVMAEQEQALATTLLDYLRDKPGVRIYGQDRADGAGRVPTVSFTAAGLDPATVAAHVDGAYIGIRYGDFYARRLIEALGLGERNGVVRVSMVHYNTLEELDALIACLDELL
ncbi:MAG TPA: cysteine desulfurase-like protein [Trueperaceae bacterium]|nr:cysteine desulfurase-like protein [Trueperaceae bacterium]